MVQQVVSDIGPLSLSCHTTKRKERETWREQFLSFGLKTYCTIDANITQGITDEASRAHDECAVTGQVSEATA